jgi:hypothetical protein
VPAAYLDHFTDVRTGLLEVLQLLTEQPHCNSHRNSM